MSKLDSLIKEKCPDGVKYLNLEQVCSIDKGVQFNKENMNKSGSYPVINGGINPSGFIEQFNQDENTITISQGGASAGYVNWITTKFWAGAHCYIIKPNELVLNRFLYHFIKSREYSFQECQYGAGIPALNRKTVAETKIPVPPIEVQNEIVQILDNFAELTAELTAELSNRKKQYEYYRDLLLNFNENEQRVEWVFLKDVVTIKNGKDYKHFGEGDIPVYGSGGIMKYIDHYSYDGETVLLPRKGSISNVFYSTGKIWNVDTIFYTVMDREVIRPKFFYYLMQSYHLEKIGAENPTRPSLSQSILYRLKIPVPPITIQDDIVSRLDRFNILANDISEGLPAEIEAREKQYAYYRDKLLSFKELVPNA